MAEKTIPSNKGIKIPKELLDIAKIEEETGNFKNLHDIATRENALLLSFIAPLTAKRTSPIHQKRASIGLIEEFAIEYVTKIIDEKMDLNDLKSIYIIINTPGGDVISSYKIASFLRSKFVDKEIVMFIPHMAASGGTLLSFAANKIVMSDMAQLTPIDTQLPYNYTHGYVSALSYLRATSRLNEYFQDKEKAEAPYPMIAMSDKLDPIIESEYLVTIRQMEFYARKILKSSGYLDVAIEKIIDTFLFTDFPHQHAILKKEAKSIGLNIADNPKLNAILDEVTHWFSYYVLDDNGQHIIKYILPTKVEEVKPEQAKKVTGMQLKDEGEKVVMGQLQPKTKNKVH